MSKLQGKVALVTGSSRGIGRAIAERLARDGAAIAVNFSGKPDEAVEVVGAIEAAGGRAVAVQADLSRVPEIRRLFLEVDRQLGTLDILVNNAGIGMLSPLADVDETTFDKVFAINAKAVLFAIQEAAARLGRGGRIVNLSSSTTYFPLANTAVYAASKAVPKVFTEVLAKELGPRGITVNSVAPGPTAPGMFANAPKDMQESAAQSSPFGRIGHPDDVAGVVSFLVSDDAAWVTGQHILVNGGATI